MNLSIEDVSNEIMKLLRTSVLPVNQYLSIVKYMQLERTST